MNHYLNFTLIGEDGRFHVLLPWQNAYSVGFNAIDAHLQTVVPDAMFDRTRQLKLSEHAPEANSVDFHAWQRQQKAQDFHGYTHRLSSLISGVVPEIFKTSEVLAAIALTRGKQEDVCGGYKENQVTIYLIFVR